jgi:hypothetical protein
LEQELEDGCETARVMVICHCMRELMLNLPSIMPDTTIPRPDPSSGKLAGLLPDILAKHPGVDLAADQDLVPVPKEIANTISALASAAAQENGRNSFNDAVLVTGLGDSKHPAVKQWRNAYGFFLGWTHLDRSHASGRELPHDEVILRHMRVVEDVIEVRTRVFFDNLKSLQGLLDSINGTGEVSVP